MKRLSLLVVCGLSLFIVGCNKQVSEDLTAEYTSESWKEIIPASCQAFHDGCNTCRRMEPGSDEVACTKIACEEYSMAYCLDDTDGLEDNQEVDTVSGSVVDYKGLTIEEAQALAEQNNAPFRVVEIDGVSQPITADIRPGRINAITNSDIVTSFTVEQ